MPTYFLERSKLRGTVNFRLDIYVLGSGTHPPDHLQWSDANEQAEHMLQCLDIKTNAWGTLSRGNPKFLYLLHV